MQLYAQHGYGPSDKLTRAVEEGNIDGVIFSPRYIRPNAMGNIAEKLTSINEDIELFLDPEYYATNFINEQNAKLGYLEEWPYFRSIRRNLLLTSDQRVDEIINQSIEIQLESGVNNLITPNVFINTSFDSIDAALAIKFIQRSNEYLSNNDLNYPLYVSLLVNTYALSNRKDFLEFIDTLTGSLTNVQGIYTIVGNNAATSRPIFLSADIVQREVLGGWMYLNYALELNGFEVLNGYSDLAIPFLAAAGGTSGATGWWSNLQSFSLNRYIRTAGGGRLPVIRYLSNALLGRITFDEREAFAELVPQINNNLSYDEEYIGTEPDRTVEILQSWEAINDLNTEILNENNINSRLETLLFKIDIAEQTWRELDTQGMRVRGTISEYLNCLRESINYFKELAEIDSHD